MNLIKRFFGLLHLIIGVLIAMALYHSHALIPTGPLVALALLMVYSIAFGLIVTFWRYKPVAKSKPAPAQVVFNDDAYHRLQRELAKNRRSHPTPPMPRVAPPRAAPKRSRGYHRDPDHTGLNTAAMMAMMDDSSSRSSSSGFSGGGGSFGGGGSSGSYDSGSSSSSSD